MKYDEVISELLGILQSINYDKVINDLEINALKKWIDINNNNGDPRFQEIIIKLNKIIEDNIITEEEKTDIIKITEQYYELGKNLIGVNELVGIVEGIIFDNEINDAEINKLNEWINNNIQLSGTFFYDKIASVVKEVLSDGILDEQEKQQLKILLTFLLKDNNLNHRIEVLKKKVKNNEMIGNQLIELINDNTIISKIHRESIQQLKTLLKKRCSVYDIDSEIIYISLTLIALLNYDGNYYDHVAETYSELYEIYTEQKIEGQIRNVLSKYKNEKSEEYRIISSVLKNAIVPKFYLPSFFEFIFDIYRLNFDYGIDPQSDLNEEFSFVYDGIKKDLNFENDSLNLKVTNKTYSLIKSTKDLILEVDKVNELITLSISVLKIIDNYYWSNLDLDYENEYFKYGFDYWKQKISNSIQKIKTRNIEFKSMWEPEFKLDGNKIYLVIPNHKIKSFYNFEDLIIEITNGESLVYKNDSLNVYDIIGGYRIENEDVLIDDPIGNLRYKLMCGNDVIYDSKEKLYRKHIFFNSAGKEMKNNRDYEGVAIICNKEKVNNIQLMSEHENYIIGFINVKIGDYFKINEEIFNFTTIQSPGILGKPKKGKCIIENQEMPIYEEVDGIIYETENELNKVVIVINGKRYRLNEVECVIKKRGNYNNILVKPKFENGKYDVIFEENEGGSYHQTEIFKFILDKEFEYYIEQISSDEYLVTINYLKNTYNKSINCDIDDICLIKFEDISFAIQINIPLFKLDNENWKNILENYIWIKDLNSYSNLRINGFDFTKVCVNDENGNLLTTLFPSTSKYYFDLSIGTLKSYESHNYITLDFYNDDKKIGVLYCYCQCILDNNKTHFWYDEQKDSFNGIISYFGKGNIIVKVLDQFETTICEKRVDNEEEFLLENLKSFENYKLQIVDKKIGFTLEKDKVIYAKNIKYYSMKNFVGRYFPIYLVNFDQMIEKKFTRKSRLLYSTYIEILEAVNEYEFTGNIYVYKGDKRYLDRINPVEIEFTSDINEGQIEASITKDGDGLFNDFEHHTILNATDSKTAIDIFSYVINMERK